MTTETIYLAGGCFWCTEAVFSSLSGVNSVVSGYMGGASPDGGQTPTYGEVSSGSTGHAETIKIDFDPSVIKLEDILEVFFDSHDPTTLNRQGTDVGTQYRSAIFYTNENQKKMAEDLINKLSENKKIVTELKPAGEFFQAEDYHQDYYKNNPESRYCQIVISPKLEKLQKQHKELLK